MIARIQLRRDNSGNWTSNDPILTLGEIGYETDTNKFKVGDGLTQWTSLNYELGQWNSDSSGNLSYGTRPDEGDVYIQKNLIVEGNFTVNGTTTTVNTEEVTIEDNMILLNSNITDDGFDPPDSLQSGIEVNLGGDNRKLYWDQQISRWVIDTDLDVLGDIYSNGSALWRLNNDGEIYYLGNVGIGTDNPDAKLVVEDTSLDQLKLVYDATRSWRLRTGSSGDLIFKNSSNSELMRIDSTGRVGIGTSSPSGVYKLSVENTSGGSIGILSKTSDSNSASLKVENSTGSTSLFEYQNKFTVRKNSTDAVVIDSTGNVGIGTSSPDKLLHIAGFNTAIVRIENTDDELIANQLIGGLEFEKKDPSGAGAGVVGGVRMYSGGTVGEQTYMAFSTSDSSTNDNEAMRISHLGKVGIGTPSPTSKLTVFGSGAGNAKVQIEGQDGADPYINFLVDETTHFAVGLDADDDDKFKISDHSALGTNDRLVIDTDGNVGIGTSDPNYELTIGRTGDSSSSLQLLSSTTGTGPTNGLRIWNTGLSSSLWNYDNTPTLFATNNLERMRIDSTGKVGIGTSSPDVKFVVEDTSLDQLKLVYDATRSWRLRSGSSGALIFKNSSNSEVMRIDSSGRVGIEITSPSEKLDVNGAIKIGTTTTTNAGTIRWTGTDFQGYTGPTDGWQSLLTPSGLVSSQWTTSGNDIYYDIGNVGIGTTNLSEKLDVDGNIKVYGGMISLDSNWNVWLDGSSGTSFQINDTTGVNTTFEYGNVGIGYSAIIATDEKLQVNGAIKIGTTTTNNAGTIKYTSNDFFGYNGTEWLSLTSGGGSSLWTQSGNDIYYDIGNVGIGATPLSTERLYVSGKSTTVGRVRTVAESQEDATFWASQSSSSYSSNVVLTNNVTNKYDFKIQNTTGNNFEIQYATDASTWSGAYIYSPVFTLHAFTGDISATGTITSSSDLILKENLEIIENPIEKVKKINGYTFNKKGETPRLVGLVAQEVDEVLPEAVSENQDGIKSLAYGNMVALLVECIKKQDERIETLEKKLEELS